MSVTLPDQNPPSRQPHRLSIVVPVFNERDNIPHLVDEIDAALAAAGLAYELICIDDGSTDDTSAVITELQLTRPHLRLLTFRRNFGQTAAMAAGFDHARGDIVVPLDGDLQNDPADIPRLLDQLDEGYDVVSGWRKQRRDKAITRRIPSWFANRLIAWITGLKIHDYGCTLKAYRKEVVEHIHLYGEMHRFIPAIASWYGARVGEIVVNHRPRTRGRANYGLSRTLKVIFDLITVKFMGSFRTKPLYVFGSIGLLSMLGAVIAGLAALYQKFISPVQLSLNRNPFFYMTILLLLAALQFIFMGLLAEMLARTYHEAQQKPTYVIRRVVQAPEPAWRTPPPPNNDSQNATA